jgi:hypothetical protein
MSAINQFKIVSLGKTLDTYDDLDISLTYQIDDIENITLKKSSFSKTIILPGTPNNNEYFKNIYDVNIDISETSYNPKKALPVQVLIGDELIFQGNLQLLNIITNQKQVDYEIIIAGVFKNIMVGFADYYLSQLDLKEYDHYRSVSSIQQSWDNIININNPDPLLGIQSSQGTGYIYPITISGQNVVTAPNGVKVFNAFDLNPAVYVKTLIDKMFEFAGYSYTSNFFNTDYFKSLVVPTETPEYSSQEILDKTVRVTYDTPQPFQRPINVANSLQQYFSPLSTLSGTVALSKMLSKSNSYWSNSTYNGSWYFPLTVESGTYGNIVMQDPNNEWSFASPYEYTCGTSGFYSVDLKNRFYMFYRHELGSNFKYVSGNLQYRASLVKVSTTGAQTVLYTTNALDMTPPGAGAVGVYNGLPYVIPTTGGSAGIIPNNFLHKQNSNNQPASYVMNMNIPSVWLNAGEKIRIKFELRYPTSVTWQSTSDRVVVGAISQRTIDGQVNRLEVKPSVTNNYSVNGLIKLSTMLPTMKMRDFFIDIIKMFNLMVADNPNKDNDLIIEPRDDFFNSKRKVNDWTLKLDYDQDVKQTPMSELDTKSYKFTYGQDKDYYNELYEQQSGKVYGEYTVDFINDFSTEQKEISLNFSPTPVSDNIITPLIAPFFCDIDTSNSLKPIKVKPRILFTKKLQLPNQFYGIRNNPTQAYSVFTDYMYSGMYDDPLDPEYSLEFGNSNVLYYNTSLCCPNNTLVNQFYLSTLNDITDVNAKLMEAYFHLTPSDINKFDFRDIILIDNSYWRVNTIVDYNPNAIDRTTKVILYKLNYLDIFYNNNKEVALSSTDCPEDIVTKKLYPFGYVYVSLSNTPITEDCCSYYGGIWAKGNCVVTQPIINNPGGKLPGPNPTKPQIKPEKQLQSGSIYLERPFEMLKNLNVINSDTVLVKGENNYVPQGVNNSIIIGSNNSIPSGVSNTLVIGDNIDSPRENSIVVGDILIDSDGIRYYYVYKIDGGLNTVMNDGKTNLIDVIDGTFNSVRNYGGDSKLRPIISGADGIIE